MQSFPYFHQRFSNFLKPCHLCHLKVWVEVGMDLSCDPFCTRKNEDLPNGNSIPKLFEAMAAPSFMWLDSVGRRKLLSYGLTGVTWLFDRGDLAVRIFFWDRKVSQFHQCYCLEVTACYGISAVGLGLHSSLKEVLAIFAGPWDGPKAA